MHLWSNPYTRLVLLQPADQFDTNVSTFDVYLCSHLMHDKNECCECLWRQYSLTYLLYTFYADWFECLINTQSTASIPESCALEQHREQIARCFSGDSVEEIVSNLEHDQSPWAHTQLSAIKKMVCIYMFCEICYRVSCTTLCHYENGLYVYVLWKLLPCSMSLAEVPLMVLPKDSRLVFSCPGL